MQIGVTTRERLIDKAQAGAYSDVISVSKLEYDKPFRFRLLDVPHKVRRVFYPTVRQEDDGTTKSSWNAVNLPLDQKTVFDFIAAADKKMKIENLPEGTDPKTVRSNLEPSARYVVPVLDRRDAEPTVKLLEMGWSVVEQLKDLQEAVDPEDNTMLADGLLTLFDITITAKKDTRRGGLEWHQRYYTIGSVRGNKFAGRIPVTALETSVPEGFDYVESGAFTQEEMEAVGKSTVDIEKETTPASQQEMVAALEEFPMNLAAVDRDGDPFFVDSQRLLEHIKQFEIRTIEYSDQETTTAKAELTPAPAEQPKPAVKEQPKPAPPKPAPPKAEKAEAKPSGSLKSKPAW